MQSSWSISMTPRLSAEVVHLTVVGTAQFIHELFLSFEEGFSCTLLESSFSATQSFAVHFDELFRGRF